MKKFLNRFVAAFLSVLLFMTVAEDGIVKNAILRQCELRSYVYAQEVETTVASDSVENEYWQLKSFKEMVKGDVPPFVYDIKGTAVDVAKSQGDSKIQSTIGDSLGLIGAKSLKDATKMQKQAARLTSRATNMTDEISSLSSKVGTYGSKGTAKRLDKLMAKQKGNLATAEKLTTKSKALKVFGKVATGVSVGFDAYNVYSDYDSFTSDSLHNHSSMKAVEKSLYALDAGVSIASMGLGIAVLAGMAVAPELLLGVAIAGTLTGIATTIAGSEGFANLMNNTDTDFLKAFDNLVDSILQSITVPSGVGCYKPNIYVYNAKGKRIRVTFDEPGLLVTCIPDYSYADGWDVYVTEDDRLVASDGHEYDFLFYESVTEERYYQTESGFAIPMDNRAERFDKILASYGFNQQEIADFVEFWDEKLEADKDYVMYPQGTQTVDIAMPIEVSPLPDSITRMWFVFRENQGQSYSAPQITPIIRDGYTVVEWGGMIY